MYVGYKSQTPLTIIDHLYNMWVKVTNADKVAALDAFYFAWTDTPDAHIRTYTRQLEKIQRRLRKMKVPCTDEAIVIQYVDQMNKSGGFKESELLEWDNTASLQTWPETTKHFTEIWVDRMAFTRRQEDNRPFDSALALSPRSNARGTVGGLTPNQRNMCDAKMDSLVEALKRADEETATL